MVSGNHFLVIFVCLFCLDCKFTINSGKFNTVLGDNHKLNISNKGNVSNLGKENGDRFFFGLYDENMNKVELTESRFYPKISNADRSEKSVFLKTLLFKRSLRNVKVGMPPEETDLLTDSEKSHAAVRLAWDNLFGDFALTNVSKSKEIFEEYATIGNPMAHTGLGVMYASGIGINYSPARALIHLTLGAANDNYLGYMALAYRYLKGINVLSSCETALGLYKKAAREVILRKKGFDTSIKHFVRLLDNENDYSSKMTYNEYINTYYYTQAERGDYSAQTRLGILYYRGNMGLKRDMHKALYYLKKAADGEDHNVDTYAYLGLIYLEGFNGIKSDYNLAFSYLRRAADMKSDLGMYYLGIMHLLGHGIPKNINMALVYITLAAEQGLTDAISHLGLMHLIGLGVNRDFKIAYNYTSLASRAGNIYATYHLGQIYEQGLGVERSCSLAAHSFKKVAEQGEWSAYLSMAYDEYDKHNHKSSYVQYGYLAEIGYEIAQSNSAFLLEKMYEQGSYALNYSRNYWSRSADQGYSFANVKLGDYYFYGINTQVDYENAASHYKSAWNQRKDAQAMFNLGYMYEHGYGTLRDLRQAKNCYEMAAEANDDAEIPISIILLKLYILDLLITCDILFYNFDIALLVIMSILYYCYLFQPS